MFKILFIDILNNYKILLTVQNQKNKEIIKVEFHNDLIDKADNYKQSNKYIKFKNLLLSNQEQYKAINFY